MSALWDRRITDPLDIGCEHERCDHLVCVYCEPGCEACAQEADDETEGGSDGKQVDR